MGSRSLTGRWRGKFSIKLPAEISPSDVLWMEFSLYWKGMCSKYSRTKGEVKVGKAKIAV